MMAEKTSVSKAKRAKSALAGTPKQPQQSASPDGDVFYGLRWDEPLTAETVKCIQDTYGPLAKDLLGLADLIRESHKKYSQPGQVKRGDARWIEIIENIRLMCSVEKCGILIRTFASAKLLRPMIEPAAGSEQEAREFYEAIYTAITGHDVSFDRMMLGALISRKSKRRIKNPAVINFQADLFRESLRNAKRHSVESVCKTLESWHNNDLLIHTGEQGRTETKAGQKAKPIKLLLKGMRSKPMSKTLMRKVLGIENEHTFNAWAKTHDIQPAGNRQTWTICLDNLNPKDREKIETIEV
jgi:hypothetical protein